MAGHTCPHCTPYPATCGRQPPAPLPTISFSAGSWGGQAARVAGAGSFPRAGVGGSPTGWLAAALPVSPPPAPASFGSKLVFPFLPKAFLWLRPSSLAAAGQQAGALSPAADEKPISRSRWSSHPSSPAALGAQRSSCLEGKSSPSPSSPTGLGAGQVTLRPCCSKRIFGVRAPGAPPLSPASRQAFLLCPLALCPQPSTLCPITSASPQPLPQPPVLPAKFLSGQSLRPLGLDASGVLAGLGFLFLSRPSPRHAPGPLLAFAQRCGIGSSLGTRGLLAEPTSRFGCPASLTLPRGAASHTHPVPSRSHHPQWVFARG